jgi:hypothetical protein
MIVVSAGETLPVGKGVCKPKFFILQREVLPGSELTEGRDRKKEPRFGENPKIVRRPPLHGIFIFEKLHYRRISQLLPLPEG